MSETALPTDAGDSTLRTVDLTVMGEGRYKATNVRGGVLPIGQGEDPDFTPVELLLASLGGCGAIDLEWVTKKRAPFTTFAGRAEGHKVRDEHGNHVVQISVTFDVAFPEGEAGDRAREIVPRTLQQVQDRLCTVGRTVALGEPVSYVEGTVAL